MKDTLLIFIFFFLLCDMTFGQNHDYKFLNDDDQELINELSSTFKDTSIPFLLSPFVAYQIDTTHLNIPEIIKKYGFNKNELLNFTKDTFIIQKNDYFMIINSDSLVKLNKIPNYTIISNTPDSKLILEDPLLYYINEYYGKRGICSFSKVIYTKNKKYAIIEYWMHCGSLCGYGEIVIMKKVKNKWIKLETLVMSES